MPPPTSEPFSSGRSATEQVTADPFWSVVRRRHRDVDIVLLPTGGARPAPAGAAAPPVVDPAAEAEHWEEETGRLWGSLIGNDRPSQPSARWTAGRTSGAFRHETTRRLDDVEPIEGVAAVERARRALTDDGWHVLAPADGLPRVLAGRGEGPQRIELQLVHAPVEGRLVLRLRSADVRLAAPPTADDQAGREVRP